MDIYSKEEEEESFHVKMYTYEHIIQIYQGQQQRAGAAGTQKAVCLSI